MIHSPVLSVLFGNTSRWFWVLLMWITCSMLPAQDFQQLLIDLPKSEMDIDSLIQQYVSAAGGFPRLEGDTAIFLVNSPMYQPKLLSGFNGFLNPRYIVDSTAGDMRSIAGSSWYYFKKKLEPDARIFYQIYANGRAYNDPLNPRLGYRFNMINSEFHMPQFNVHKELIWDQFIPQGEVTRANVNSSLYGDQRVVHVYQPAGYHRSDSNYSTVYFHDGSFYLNWGKVPQILDYLIAYGYIEPVVAVFDDPLERGKEYRGDSAYRYYVEKELIPYVDSQYRTKPMPEHRAVIGGSRGGLSALILSHSIPSFSKCGTFSPAIHPRDIDEFISFLSSSEVAPQQVAIIGAIYDEIWYPDALALKDYFSEQQTSLKYLDISQGHNIQAWVNYLDELLTTFFPPK